MTVTLRQFTLLVLTICALSCEDELSLEGPFVDVPTAYAFIDADEERHFVRVQKAFLRADGTALENAMEPDSIYYGPQGATVKLTNETTRKTVILNRVDGRDFGLERAPGPFATEPNILYTTTREELELSGGDGFRLNVERPGQTTATARATAPEDATVVGPRATLRIEPYGDGQATTISIRRPAGAEVFAINAYINLRAGSERRQLLWQVTNDFVPSGSELANDNVRYALDNTALYRFLSENLSPRASGVYSFIDLDLEVIAAGRPILDRRSLANANSGLTSSQVTPRYTNLDGGIGLVTGISRVSQAGITLSNASSDSLRNGVFTRDLF